MRFFFLMVLPFLLSNFLSAQNNQSPRCALDALNEKRAQQDEQFRRELDYYLQEIVPRLSRTESDYRSAEEIITIPVVVHVIHNGEPVGTGQNISEAQILDQIAVLNEDYTALNPNYDDTPARWQAIIGNPEVEFCLAQVDPFGGATNGITRDNIEITGTDYQNNNIDTDIKEATNWDPNHYYNIYVVAIPGTDAGGGVLGWAYYPNQGTVGSTIDGAVVDYRWFGGPNSDVSGFKTLTHETGHYLGLPHPFDGNSCNSDDGIDDTPNASQPTQDVNFFACNNGFPTGPTTCTEEHMYVNYMDYSHSSCYTSFSHDQINVMRGVLDGTTAGWGYASREELVNYANTACNVVSVDAGITDILTPNGTVCSSGSISPIVVLKNFGSTNLTSVKIRYTVNGSNLTTYNWSGNLAQGATEEVVLPSFFPPVGQFDFVAYTFNPNNSTDGNPANDEAISTATLHEPEPLPLSENFEEDMFNPTASGMIVNDLTGDGFMWERSTEVSAYGNGNACAVYDNFAGSPGNNPGGTLDVLYSAIYDFSGVADATLTFDVAYARYDNLHSDSLFVMISTDCANTFGTALYVKGGTDLATAPDQTSSFTPTSSQWRTETIDLSAYGGEQNVTLAFVNKSGWGNRLFLDNISMRGPCDFSITVTGEDASCYGVCDGIAYITPTNATGDLTYNWQIGSTTLTADTATSLCAGTYQVTVTDGLGCSADAAFSIGEPDSISVALSITQAITCHGATDGSVSSTVTGGTAPYTYLWSNGQTDANLTDVGAGTYTLTVTDAADCTAEASISLTAPDAMEVDLTITQEVACNGTTDGSVSSTVTGGTAPYTYLWSNGQTGANLTDVGAGTYSVTVTDAADCTAEASIALTAPDAMTVDLIITQEVACSGATNGSVSSTVTGGTAPFSYLWSNGQTSADLTNIGAGTYSVTVTDAADCTAEASITLSESSSLEVELSLVQSVSCFGEEDAAVESSVTGGISPYDYAWSTEATTANISGLGAGDYFLTVTDDAGCSTVAQITITQPDVLNVGITLNQGISCFGDNEASITAHALGGTASYSFIWNTGANSVGLDNIPAGTYTVTVTDAHDCVADKQIIITQPDELTLSLSSTAVTAVGAADGTATATVGGGTPDYTYLWSNGGNTAVITGLEAGNYQVTVTDAADCSVSGTITVNSVDCNLTASMEVTNASCPGQSDAEALVITENGTAPFNYHWSDGQVHNPAVILPAGAISCTVTDAAGCEVTVSATISDADDEIPVVHGNDLTVYLDAGGNASVSVEDVDAGSTDNCGIASMTLSQTDFDCTDVGTHQVSFTVTDNSGNSATEEVTITVVDNQPPTVVANDLSLVLDANGEVTITPAQVDNGSTDNCGIGSMSLSQTTFTCDDLGTNEVVFTVTTTGGETASQTVSIVVTDTTPPTLSAQNVTLALDEYGQATLTAAMANVFSEDDCGAPVISFSQVDFTCEDIGTQEVVVTAADAGGLTTTQTIEVTVVDDLSPVVSVNDITLSLNAEGTGDLTPDMLDNNSTDNCGITEMTASQNIFTCDDLGVNEVIFRATDGAGNSSEATVTVTVIDEIPPQVTCPSDVTVNSCVPIEVTFDTPVFTDNCEVTNAEFTQGMESGAVFPTGVTHEIFTVTDAGGNSGTCEFTVDVSGSGQIIVVIDTVINASAADAADGAIYLSVFGGDGNYTYEWRNESGDIVSTEEDLVGVLPGIYSLEVTDGTGCVILDSNILVDFTVEVAAFGDGDVRLFPNPTKRELYLKMKLQGEEPVTVKIADVTGRIFLKTKKETISEKTYSFDLSGYPKGVYFVRVQAGEKVLTRRIILL